MWKVKSQNGTMYMVKRVYVNMFKTVRRTYFFLMGNDTDILGVFASAKEAQRAETNFNKWAMALDTMEPSVYFNVAQDLYSDDDDGLSKEEILKNRKERKDRKEYSIKQISIEKKVVEPVVAADVKEPVASK